MNSSNRTPTHDLPLEPLVAGALHLLEGLVYRRKSLWSYRAVWKQLTEFGGWSARLVSTQRFPNHCTTATLRCKNGKSYVAIDQTSPHPFNSLGLQLHITTYTPQ